MKRSSSKLISKAGSVRNINKQAYKFRFSLQVETVNKLLGSSEVVVTWERGAKVLSTKPARIDKSTRTANFGNELLEQEVTLFKRKKEGSSFEDKVFRLTTRQGNEKGKVMGRIDINFSDYVEIPTFSKRIAAALSNGGQIVMRVQSTYLGEAKRKGKNSSLGSSSVTSSHIDVSSGPDEDTTKRDEDLHDLDIPEMESDFPPTAPSAPISKSSSSNTGRYTSSSSVTHDSMNDNASNVPPRKKGQGAVVPPVSNEHRMRPSANGRRSPVNTEGSTRPGAARTELERLRKENRELRRKNDDLSDRNAELEYRLSRGGSADSASLEEENASLRNEVTDLQHQLSREPVYADVVKELREAKMALAILTLERDELTRQLRQKK